MEYLATRRESERRYESVDDEKMRFEKVNSREVRIEVQSIE